MRRAPRRDHPVTKRELVENNPSIADAVTNRLGPLYRLAVATTAIGAFLWGGYTLYDWSGARKLVSDVTLTRAISEVKNEVNVKIDSTKNDVLQNQNVIKGEITGSIGELTKTLATISKSQLSSAMDQADTQQKLAFTQMQSLQGQLATINQSLAKPENANDQTLTTRKIQLEGFIRQNERDMQDAKDKMQRLRSTQ